MEPSQNSQAPPMKISTLVSSIGFGMFMSSLDATIVVIILEKIKSHYGVTSNEVQWVILSYLLTMMAFTTIAGDLGDKFSNKLIFQIGMALFALGSLFCFLSGYFGGSIWWLVLSRAIQGLGATGMLGNGMALVTRFTTKKNRGTAVGINNLLISISVITGPVFGALISDAWEWGGVFLINVPLGIIGFIWIQFVIPKTPPVEKEHKADYVGSILFAIFLTTLILSFTIFVDIQLANAKMWAGISLLTSIIIFPIFILWERKTEHPLVDLSMLKNKKISIGLFTAIIKHQGYIIIIYHINLYLQEMGIETDILRVGLIISGLPVGMAIAAGISGKLSNTVDARYLCTIAMVGVTIMLALLSIFIDISTPTWFYVIVASVIGMCIGLFLSPNGNSIMSAAPKEKLGVASGLHGLTTSIGINLGIALSTLVFTLSGNLLSKENGLPPESPVNYVQSMKWMFLIFAVITGIAAVVSFFRGPEDRTLGQPSLQDNQRTQ